METVNVTGFFIWMIFGTFCSIEENTAGVIFSIFMMMINIAAGCSLLI